MGFLKTVLRSYTTRIGVVTGSDFQGCSVGPTRKDGAPALVFYGLGKKDFVFNKEDVKEFSIIESGNIIMIGSQRGIGNKYKIIFNNGQSAILNIPADNCHQIEKVLY